MPIDSELTLPPDRLYKFMTLAAERWDWFANLVRRGEIYLSSPTDFNDPFDCLPRVIAPPQNDRVYRRRLQAAGIRRSHSRAERRRNARAFVDRPAQEIRRDFTRSALNRIRAVGVYCITASNDHPLMWSHYAEKHTGICVGFRADRGPFVTAQKVIYSDARPHYDYSSHDLRAFHAIYHTKASFWQYEREYRLLNIDIGGSEMRQAAMRGFEDDADLMAFIGRDPGPGLHRLSTDLIQSITFGCRTPASDKQRVLDLLQREQRDVALYQAALDENTFTLSIRPF